MPLSTTSYGYVVDPLLALTNEKGKTISDGYIRVFFAGSSTPAPTYANYDGALNEENIQLDNSGRCATLVIASNKHLYKVCVYDKKHSPDNPLFTLDNVAVTVSSAEFTHTTDVDPGTYTKVKVNAEGLVEEGGALQASDIPNLPASKIASGTLDPDRIADESINGDEKLQDGSVGASKIAVDASKGLVDGLNTTVRIDDNDVMVDAHDETITNLKEVRVTADAAAITQMIRPNKYYVITADADVEITLTAQDYDSTIHSLLFLASPEYCVNVTLKFQLPGTYGFVTMAINVEPDTTKKIFVDIRKMYNGGVAVYPARVWELLETFSP